MLASAPRSVRVLVQLLLVTVIAGAAYLYAPPIGAISADALQHSLAREVGGATDKHDQTCVNRTSDIWRCGVDDPSAGGAVVVYDLTRHGRRCWDATQVNPGQGRLPANASACVALRDQVRPEQRL
jgi:hypothetical protein